MSHKNVGQAVAIVVAVLIVAFFFGGAFVNFASLRSAAKPSDQAAVAESERFASNGLRVNDVLVGSGPAAESGDTLVIHYTGGLSSGEKIDSSLDRGQPFEFPLGVGFVIPGLDQGLIGMKVGGERNLVIPPSLAYGETGYPPVIPPNSILIFDIQLLEIKER